MIAPRVRDVYVLDMTSPAQESCFFAKAFENLNWLWHKRLAHLNFKTINKLAKQNLVIDLPLLVHSKDKPCSSCEKGKHHRANFKTKHTSFIKKCLHLLHMNLFGPVTPRSINHEKYTLVIVDEYSRYTWVYFLKKKVKHLKLSCPSSKELKIKMTSKSNNSELTMVQNSGTTSSSTSVMKNGFLKTFPLPTYLNKMVLLKGKNRTLIKASRTMLSGSVFLKQYWTKAVAISCYTQNRSTIMKRHLKTPYEIFLSKAFRVFNTRRQQIEETYHIIFDESADAIKFSKPSVDNINIAANERYPPDEYLHPYEPSQRYQTNNNDVSFIEPYECPEPVVLQTKVSSDQNGQTDQNDQSIFEHSSSLRVEDSGDDTSIQNIIPILNSPLSIPSVVTPPPQDRWPQDKHIKLVNIIDFLSEEEPKKVTVGRLGKKELSKRVVIQCLGGKTGGLDQISNKDAIILYCLANGVKVDYARLIWEDIIHKLSKKTREKVVPYPRFISLLLEYMMPVKKYDNERAIHYPTHVPVDSKAPQPSSQTEEVFQGKKPGAKNGLRRKQSSKHTSKTKAQPSFTSLHHGFYEIIKEPQLAAGVVQTALGATSKEGSHPQLSNASAKFPAVEADPGLSALNDSIPSQQDQTKSARDGLKTAQTDSVKAQVQLLQSQKDELEQQKAKAKAKVASLKARPSFPDINQLTNLLVTSLNPELSKLLASHNFASCLLTELKELPSKFTELSEEIKELKQHELPAELQALPVLVSSVQKQLKTLDSLPSLLKKVIETLNRFAIMVENASESYTMGCCLQQAKQQLHQPRGEENTPRDAETNCKINLVDLLGYDMDGNNTTHRSFTLWI
ncbi:retrovirus-related pol polyprotein from transposon TNT 1-94 [Tanacetum coccineum]|uniref:Retrovirus-related pol polyprotein from transposon TNT 1-94 n=1 Tax=Tanacetum coccineum TaxID=301880 RepID=A0ABQ5H3V1_9ASTR